MKKHLVAAIAAASLASLSCIATQAATGAPGLQTLAAAPTQSRAPLAVADLEDDGLTAVFSNFEHHGDAYFATAGATISRKVQPGLAQGFTPQQDFLVKKIRVAVSNSKGEERAYISLHADAGGVPGESLWKAEVKGMPRLGECCATQHIDAEQGVPVQAGKLYWVVVHMPRGLHGTAHAWNFSVEGLDVPTALIKHHRWVAVGDDSGLAFSVLGTPANR
jgi:hypothetical protein